MPWPSEAEIAWAAGLFEGEGTVYASIGVKAGAYIRKTPYLVLRISMRDKDVLERWVEIVGGKLYGPYQAKRPNDSPIYQAQIHGAAVRPVVKVLRPWLGQRRIEQVDRALSTRPLGVVDAVA